MKINDLVLYWHALDIWLTARPKLKVALTAAEAAFIGTITSYIDGVVTGHTIFDMNGLKRTILIAASSAFLALWNLAKRSIIGRFCQ